MKCPAKNCEEQLEKISFTHGDSNVAFKDGVKAYLYVCTSRDCKNCGIVLAIPAEPVD